MKCTRRKNFTHRIFKILENFISSSINTESKNLLVLHRFLFSFHQTNIILTKNINKTKKNFFLKQIFCVIKFNDKEI